MRPKNLVTAAAIVAKAQHAHDAAPQKYRIPRLSGINLSSRAQARKLNCVSLVWAQITRTRAQFAA